MSDTNSFEGFQDVPRDFHPFLEYLVRLLEEIEVKTRERIASEREEVYLELRKTVIVEFREYEESAHEVNYKDFLSNVLVGMERCFQKEQE